MDLLMQQRIALLAFAVSVLGCVPELDSDEATVREPRVLAIMADPAEAAPGKQVRYRALVADASGTREDLAPTWFHCLAQRPLAELGPVSRDCLSAERGRLRALGQGLGLEASLPADACALFGPNPPLPVGDEPPGRPVDADESGGYKLPVVVGLDSGRGVSAGLYEQRISCGLAGVAPAVSLDYSLRYHANENPELRELRVRRADGSLETVAAGQAIAVGPSERVELEAVWPDCPASDTCGDAVCGADESRLTCAADCEPMRGCAGAERYLYFDSQRDALVARREALRLAWYTTAGSFDEERTGAAADELRSTSTNGFRAAEQPTAGTLWLVIRDSRGGVGTAQWQWSLR